MSVFLFEAGTLIQIAGGAHPKVLRSHNGLEVLLPHGEQMHFHHDRAHLHLPLCAMSASADTNTFFAGSLNLNAIPSLAMGMERCDTSKPSRYCDHSHSFFQLYRRNLFGWRRGHCDEKWGDGSCVQIVFGFYIRLSIFNAAMSSARHRFVLASAPGNLFNNDQEGR